MGVLKKYFDFKNDYEIVGLTSELNSFCITEIFQKNDKNIIVVTNSLYEANMIYDSIKLLEENTYLFPMDDFLTSVAVAISPDLKNKRLETLENVRNNPKSIVVTNLMGYLKYLPNSSEIKNFKISLKNKMTYDEILTIIEKYGYTKTTIVTTTGEYAVRGYIIDIFLLDDEHPTRLEFFGEDLDSIRQFDESSQKSLKEVAEIILKPYVEILSKTNSSLIDYLDEPYIFKIDNDQLESSYKSLQEEIFNYKIANEIDKDQKFMYDLEELKEHNVMYLNTISNKGTRKSTIYQSNLIDNFNDDFESLKNFVNLYKGKKTIIFYLSLDSQIRTISSLFDNTNICKEENIVIKGINIIKKKIKNGFIFDEYVIISENDISKVKKTVINYKNNLKIGKKIKNFEQLELGDYVVHTLHGIGIYNGLITLTKNGIQKDYLQINYDGNDKIYIPVEKISTIFKYTCKDGLKPRINKLNSTAWAKTKRQLTKKIKDISEELIKLYAERKKIKVEPYSKKEEENLFEVGFPYEETTDQLKAIADINRDLEDSTPMDRLLCGDVGFGKTEVAFRGMFKAVYNGKQVFYLCPTTILSKQQYENAKVRFADFPVEIALLNRFTPKKEVERIIKGLDSGFIDIVFGTHRLLSDDIKFKNLGLLVVDEEQRFGVTHKEKIKKYKKDVNVLTLSATPIPRTLKMALSGLRDLSIIDTPPVNRYPVQTYVIEEQDLLIKDAIYKELSRKGQVFILYNKVETILDLENKINLLVPEARITYAHGQMNKTELENVMQAFIDYEYDILICTTIIETGIDIPNANTLIVIDADRFGLSQLYQLRGRVGRSNRIGYAYLMYNKEKVLSDVAIKRLQAIKNFTELGSGYRIAMRDLSIRGAGDILGSEQAGFVDSVGIELYMKMIEDEIKKLNGEEVEEEDVSNTSLIDVDTHISSEYVSEEALKIEIHQKINEIDSYNKLVSVKEELEDRFGKVSKELEIYMYEEWFEKLAKQLNITKVVQTSYNITIELDNEVTSKIKGDKLFLKSYDICSRFAFKTFANRLSISLNIKNLEKHFLFYIIPLLEEIIEQVKENN